ncbi:hypothetical protein GN244_ATG17746 [Phytophthora infestans]|uniref:Uncharacterized protein n=1 Tax=Phytophthora infestans TaxID=4787 RepID=A0A833RQC0_PHYIN|nr:hypothetical protein GN244_ATG17746 [Phytophthora infestans]KAF4129467.1 hypothetical protein GN958_ATG21326 [Phytophthora infestans]KAF4142846.1 hypothetical protein GN958_ATG07956 [Phytophthora infestans]
MCCGPPHNNVQEVAIVEVSLTQTDLDVIDEVLETEFPVPAIGLEMPEYGYVEVQEGAKLFYAVESVTLDITATCRFRAVRDTGSGFLANTARVVAPGYGLCIVKIGEGAVFIPTSSPQNVSRGFQTRRIRALTLQTLVVEDDSLVVELLSKIGRGLQKLWIAKLENSPRRQNTKGLDLSVLAAICPELEELSLVACDVLVSEYNESLRRWPVKKMGLCETSRFPLIAQCLSDDTFLMATNLTQLCVTSSVGSSFSENETRELRFHNGEFLPLLKEKLPIQMKVALLSVVAGFRECTSLRSLDAYILGLIFHFASTPVRRCVMCE